MGRLIDADYILSALGIFNDREHGNEHFIFGIETAKEIVQNAPTVGGWISVKDRLPDRGVYLARLSDRQYKILAYDNGWHTDAETCAVNNVTHWTLLPEQPTN